MLLDKSLHVAEGGFFFWNKLRKSMREVLQLNLLEQCSTRAHAATIRVQSTGQPVRRALNENEVGQKK